MNILVFGDSITYGFSDIQGGWAGRLRNFIDEKYTVSKNPVYWTIYNLGIPGDTSAGLVARFDLEINPRLDPEQENIIIFAIGINDSYINSETNSHAVAIEDFSQSLYTLCALAKKYTDKIFFVGLTPVDENKTDPLYWEQNRFYRNEYVKEYDEKLREFCKTNQVHFICLLEKMVELNYPELLEDGIHPNSEGHKVIFEIVRDYLLENKII